MATDISVEAADGLRAIMRETETVEAGGGLLRERAYDELKGLILRGEFAQTPFLSERMLARQLGMSNTPVRSAVERLALEGIVSIGPQRGIVVRELTNEEVANHIELREALEPFIVRKVAERATPEQLAELYENLTEYERCLAAGDVPRFITLDGQFHLLLARFSANAEAERVLQQMQNRIHGMILRISRHLPVRLTESLREHRQIVDCLAAGDGRAAARWMLQHLNAARRVLVSANSGPPRRTARRSTTNG
jgi:GntR family transcriptional regulator, rspAB operon transcriptional repressor